MSNGEEVIKSEKLEDETSELSITKEKRIRKQKTYDDDYVLSNAKIANKLQVEQEITVTTTTTETIINEIKFNVGELVWAKVGGWPWWPCMISNDTSDNNNHIKWVGTARPKRLFHVDFFGPSVEHAWVAESGVIEYKGIEAFKTYAQDQVDQAPTKSQKEKLAERFQLKVALTRRDHWERAVDEADNAMAKRTIGERKSIFTDKKRNRQSVDDESENLNVIPKKLTKIKRESTSSVNTNEEISRKNSSRTQKRKVDKILFDLV
jgi:hypothetical protein